MTEPETCRDVLRDMLATGSNISAFDDALDSYGYPTDRIRAAIAADDADRERLRRIEEAAHCFADRYGEACRQSRVALGGPLVMAARASLLNRLDPDNLDAAQRIAGEGGRDDG